MSSKYILRALVRSFYDRQKMRIEVGNRLVTNVRTTLGQEPGTKTDDMPEEARELLKQMLTEYKRLSDAFADNTVRQRMRNIRSAPGVLFGPYEYELAGEYVNHLEREKELEQSVKIFVEDFPIWNEFLKDVKGIGPLMAAVIISEFDIHKAQYVSSLYRYAGLDVAEDGRGRSRRKEHLETVTYVDKKGEEKEKQSITFNPFLKTKLIGVLGVSFLRQRDSKYRQIYDNYKNRLKHRPDLKEASDARKHNMAVRYMVKMFLKDLYGVWRDLEGLPVFRPYHEEKLGIYHDEGQVAEA